MKHKNLLILVLCIFSGIANSDVSSNGSSYGNNSFSDSNDTQSLNLPKQIIPTQYVARSKKKVNVTPTKPYNFFFHDEPLTKALKMIANNNGMNLRISKYLKKSILNSKIHGRFTAKNNAGLLNVLASQYGFNWFIFSGTIYITDLSQHTTYIEASPDNMPDIRTYLSQIGLISPKFGYSELPSRNKILVTGPREYTQLIAREITGLGTKVKAKGLGATLEVNQQYALFRLKYANAVDTSLSFNNQQIIIPGVATILRGLAGKPGLSSGRRGHEKVATNVNELLKNKTMESSAAESDKDMGTGEVTFPQIQADERLNTIIIRDKATNLKMYKNIISELDIPAPLIQIEVTIIRLDQDKLAQQGINWWASSGNSQLGAGFGTGNLTTGVSNNLSLSYGQINPGQLIVGNIAGFNANLQFLENNNYASAEAKPSLATIDNLPAIISTTENIFSINPEVSGRQGNNNPTSNDFANSGIQLIQSLQITPHVIASSKPGKKPQIKLSIVLQNGTVNQFSNPQMPNYSQSFINSQAVINEGQSIILAGYTRDALVTTTTKVPGLGDIPVLGWLFKTTTRNVHKVTTMYLVTPKVVRQNALRYNESGFIPPIETKVKPRS